MQHDPVLGDEMPAAVDAVEALFGRRQTVQLDNVAEPS